jgi:bla regulator protein BlaR1
MGAGLDGMGLNLWSSAVSALWVAAGRHLIQATLVSGVLFGVVLLLARGPARLRHALCLVASLKFLLPSALLLAVAALFGLDLPSLSGALHSHLGGPFGELFRWLLVGGEPATAGTGGAVSLLVTLWLAGVAWLSIRWIRRHRAFGRAVRAGRVLESGREMETLERWRRRLGLRRPVALVVSDRLPEPGVWGVLQPAVVLPAGVAEHLDGAELEAVILHEMVHVRRWDNLVATVQRALCCLFWFHPLPWVLERRLLVERERVCDERVVALSGAAGPYARGLLKVLRLGVGLRPVGVSAATASNLKSRIERIRTGAGRRAWPSWVQVGLVAAGVGLLLVVSVMAVRPCTGGRGSARVEKAAAHAGVAPCSKGQKVG